MEINLALLEQLCEFETALVSEGMGALGCPNPESHYMGDDVRLLTHISAPLAGIALTMTADTSTPGNTADAGDFWKTCEKSFQMKVPTILVVKTIGGRPRHECVLGDGMAKLLKSCGSIGLITDGGARDIAQINKTGYVVFGSGNVVNHVAVKLKISEDPITISGVSVSNGDVMHADADGVLVVPSMYHKGIIEASILSREFETRVHAFWRRSDIAIAEKREFAGQLAKIRADRCQAYLKDSGSPVR
jgi:4-hydroxy-4-methyl-2-oxoglutarate aldolase